MQLLDYYPLPPGACLSCGESSGQPGVVDLDRDESGEYGVHLYLCGNCVGEAADLTGCLPPAAAERLRTVAARATAELDQLRSEVTHLRTAVEALNGARPQSNARPNRAQAKKEPTKR